MDTQNSSLCTNIDSLCMNTSVQTQMRCMQYKYRLVNARTVTTITAETCSTWYVNVKHNNNATVYDRLMVSECFNTR